MAGTLASKGRGRGMISGINVTPLVDVVLVLLIILMVSANYIVSRTLKVDLPKTASSDGAPDKPNAVVLTREGKLLWNDEQVTEQKLTDALKAVAVKDAEATLVVSADSKVEHGAVVHLLDVARGAGISRFAINVQQE